MPVAYLQSHDGKKERPNTLVTNRFSLRKSRVVDGRTEAKRLKYLGLGFQVGVSGLQHGFKLPWPGRAAGSPDFGHLALGQPVFGWLGLASLGWGRLGLRCLG